MNRPESPFRRSLSRLSIALIIAAFAIGPLAAAKKEYWKGKPEFTAGENKGYYIWQDDDGWHLRWTTKGKPIVYAGTLTCSGDFTDFKPVKKEKGEIIKKESNKLLRFDTRTEGGIDGLDFRLSPSTRTVTFDLNMDGAKASATYVKVGRNKTHPTTVPFTIDREGSVAAPAAGGGAPAAAAPAPAPAGGVVKK